MRTCRSCPNWEVADPRTAQEGDCRAITAMVTTPFLGSVLTTQAAFGCILHPRAALRVVEPMEAHARTDDPSTSHIAARSLTPTRLTKNRAAVLRYFYLVNESMTDRKLVTNYDCEEPQGPSGLRTRRAELVAMGYVEAAGTVEMGKGKPHTLWRLTEAGREKASEVMTGASH